MKIKKYKIIIPAVVLLPILIMLILFQPLISLVIVLSVLFIVLCITKQYDPMPLIAIFLITLIVSFQSVRIGPVIVIGLTFLYFLYYLLNKKNQEQGIIPNNFSFLFIWLIYGISQLIWVAHTERTFGHLKSLMFGVLIIWLMSRIVTSEKRLELLYKLWGFSTLFTIIIGWWEVLTGNHLSTSRNYGEKYDLFVTAGFYNQNDYSVFLIISLPIMLYFIKKSNFYRLISLFMIISSFYFIYLNETRSMILSFMVIILLFFINIIKEKRIVLVVLVLIVSLIIVIFSVEIILSSIDNVYSLNTDDDGSVNKRKMLTQEAWVVFKEYPLFGVGPGNLELYMPISGENVHNSILEILVNYGVFIFIGLVMFFVKCLRVFIKNKKNISRDLVTPILWSALIFIPASVTTSSILQFNFFWFLLGVMLITLNIIEGNKKEVASQLNIEKRIFVK